MHRFSSRRETLIRSAAATFAATGLSTPGVVFAQTAGGGTTQTPGVTEGPYWVDGMPNRSDVRTNSTTGAAFAGLPLQLSVTVARLQGTALTPVTGAKVDVWECNLTGSYSAVSQNNTVGQDFLRGYQLTNSRGLAKFTSIYPAWYTGRAVHTYYRVRLYSGTTVTYNFVSQLFYDDAVSDQVFARPPYTARTGASGRVKNASDMVYTGASQGTGRSVPNNAGTYLLLRLAQDASKAVGTFNVVLVY